MRLASSSGRIRKSPHNHRVVGEFIRNPTLRLLPLDFSTFPQAILKKEKEPKRKKTTATVPLLSSKLSTGNRTIRGVVTIFIIRCERPLMYDCISNPKLEISDWTVQFQNFSQTV